MAWTRTASWDLAAIQRYRAYVRRRAQEILVSQERIDCADMSLKMLVEWANHDGLPVVIQANAGTSNVLTVFDSSTPTYPTWREFMSALLSGVEAHELGSPIYGNAYAIANLADVAAGDMLIFRSHAPRGSARYGRWGHVQVVLWWSLQSPGQGAVPTSGDALILQGNLERQWLSRHPGHEVPTSVQSGYYYFVNGRFMYARDGSAREFTTDWMTDHVTPLRWNFNQFNRGINTPPDATLR
jgi:hypothetical protein